MSDQYLGYWERSWKEEEQAELYKYLDMYYEAKSNVIDIFKEHGVTKVCDAACGFGAYSLMFASNGFCVQSFDISATAVEITKTGLGKYGLDTSNVKVASILDTGYADEMFDGVIAHAVLDHLALNDTKKALEELLRITATDGLVMISFDIPEEDDFAKEHLVLEDGTMQYTSGNRKGMLFRPCDWDAIEELVKDYTVVYRAEKSSRERTVILKK